MKHTAIAEYKARYYDNYITPTTDKELGHLNVINYLLS